MAATRRQFTQAFKREAVRLAQASGKPQAQVARELGIRPDMLRSWKRQAAGRAELVAAVSFWATARRPAMMRNCVGCGARSTNLNRSASFKKSGGVRRQGVAVCYACIQAYRDTFSVAPMCRVLGISRSGFYAAQRRPASQRVQTDQRFSVEIRAIYRRSRSTYGSPRVHAELRAQGVRCGRKRVERLMRVADIRAKRRRRWRRTTNSNHAHVVAPNHFARQFAVTQVPEINRVWAGDIT